MDPRSPPAGPRLARRILDTLAVLGFLAAIAAPTVDLAVRPDEARSPEPYELRTAAPKPALPSALPELASFPARYEAYFKDSFGLRDRLLRWNSIVKVFGFGVSPTAEVFFGKDGWIFYHGEHSSEDHRGAFPFSESDLQGWAAALEKKRAVLASVGAKYLYVVVPDKESVYREFLPGWMHAIGPTRLEQWVAYMQEHAPQVEILDLRTALSAAKKGDQLDAPVYTPLGTHWSGRGSQVAVQAMLERMNELVGGFAPEELEDYRRIEFGGHGDSWAMRMYIDDLLTQPIHGFVPKVTRSRIRSETQFKFGRVRKSEIPESTRPRVMLMHDSFGPHIEAALSEQCSYLECRWEHSLDLMEVEAAHPAILVDMYVERTFNHLDPDRLVPVDRRPWHARFDLSKTSLLDVDKASPTWGFVQEGGAVIGPAALIPNPRLPIAIEDQRDAVWIGTLAPVRGEIPVLHVVIDSARETELRLWYKPPGRATPVWRHMYRAPLAKGRNELYLQLDKPGTAGELLLRPGMEAGTYLLRAFEVRSVPP